MPAVSAAEGPQPAPDAPCRSRGLYLRSVISSLALFIRSLTPRTAYRWWRRHNHRHDWHMHAFKLPRPEGGTYYQLRCSRPKCHRRRGARRFKPAQITEASVMYTLKVPLRLVPELDARAQARNEHAVDYVNRLVRRELSR